MSLLPDLRKFETALDESNAKQERFLELLTEIRDLLMAIHSDLHVLAQ